MTGPDELRRLPLLDGLSDDVLDRLVEGSRELRFAVGDHIADEGDEQAWFHVLLEGRVEWSRRLGQRDVAVLAHTAPAYFGHEPILLGIPVPVTGRALEASRAVRFEAPAFWSLLAEHPDVRRELLTTVTQRNQTLESVSQQQARLLALGTMSAGLAHELNNPAAAVRSGAEALAGALEQLATVTPRLGAGLAEPAHADVLARAHGEATARRAASRSASGAGVPLDPLARSDAEEALGDWLDQQGVDDAWDQAASLVDAGVAVADLEALADALPVEGFSVALTWLAASLSAVAVLDEVREGATRISRLVGAMRDYTYLDQGPLQEVDVHDGLESTLTILGHKLRSSSVQVTRDYDRALPRLTVHGSELNQVWTNLIDNAIDSIASRPGGEDGDGGGGGGGHIRLRTRGEGGRVVVEVADDGPGIPPGLVNRVFEPYFTTKNVGEGTGLGLDIARRIVVDSHHGRLDVRSQPGDTCFTVHLPFVVQPEADA